MRCRFGLLPRDDSFFELFEEQAAVLRECLPIFTTMRQADSVEPKWAMAMQAIEQRGDQLTSSIIRVPSAIVTGRVSSQDVKISAVIAHRTADSRRMAPTPRIDDVRACVVLTGMPSSDATWITVAPATSAANPWTGSRVVIRCPRV
jgi:hypothetical protein